jgi:hypothetical protein
MTNSGPSLDFETVEIKAPQPTALPPQTSQGVMTGSKTGTLGSTTLLSSAPLAPIPGRGHCIDTSWCLSFLAGPKSNKSTLIQRL